MKLFVKLVVGLSGLLLLLPAVRAETVIIVHPSNTLNTIEVRDIKRILTGKSLTFESGEKIKVVNLPIETESWEEIYGNLLNKTASQLKRSWSRVLFQGGGIPPVEVESDSSMVSYVAQNSNAFGYVNSDAVDSNVKVIYRIP